MTTIKSLKDMYVKLGGSLTDTYADIAGGKAVGTFSTIPEMIQACTKKASGGESLPDYTAADNGKFLGVVGGEAAWAENSGSFIVEMTAGETEGTFVSTTTYGEAYAAMESGKTVVFKMGNMGFMNVVAALSAGESFSLAYIASATPGSCQGTSSDTISISMS